MTSLRNHPTTMIQPQAKITFRDTKKELVISAKDQAINRLRIQRLYSDRDNKDYQQP